MVKHFIPFAASMAAVVSAISVSAAATPTYQTFVFINGIPTDVSASATHGNGHVYLNGAYIGDLNSSGQIIGPQGLVGFVVLLEGGGLSK
jgi:hypothetical protein